MKKLNKEMINKLAKCEICLQNTDGTYNQLKEIINAAAPNDVDIIRSNSNYYFVEYGKWRSYSENRRFISYSISAFYEQEQKSFPRWMYVNDKEDKKIALRRLVLAQYDGSYWAVVNANNDAEIKQYYEAFPWLYAWELDEIPIKKTVTFEVTEQQEQEIKKLLGL